MPMVRRPEWRSWSGPGGPKQRKGQAFRIAVAGMRLNGGRDWRHGAPGAERHLGPREPLEQMIAEMLWGMVSGALQARALARAGPERRLRAEMILRFLD